MNSFIFNSNISYHLNVTFEFSRKTEPVLRTFFFQLSINLLLLFNFFFFSSKINKITEKTTQEIIVFIFQYSFSSSLSSNSVKFYSNHSDSTHSYIDTLFSLLTYYSIHYTQYTYSILHTPIYKIFAFVWVNNNAVYFVFGMRKIEMVLYGIAYNISS